ncbi:MAG TPA: hypothetical protein PKV71_04225 [Calditrichia bacterium]|nr:hypothetical protein [Calditrichota bacterium]HQV31055.1 hypothetical protein [Calditrichia bacterium]
MRFYGGGISLLLILILSASVSGQYVRKSRFANEQARRVQYELDDWVSYLQSRHISHIAESPDYLYFATRDGGVLRYNLYDRYWDYPYTTSNGLPENYVREIYYDRENAFLYAVTRRDEAVFNPASEEWIIRSQQLSWPYQKPVNRDSSDFGRFFDERQLDKLPLFLANRPYVLMGDWRLQDENFEEFPVTGFLKDRNSKVWMAVEGFGVAIGDMFTQRADFIQLGLPNIRPRAIAYQQKDLWVAGLPANRGTSRGGIGFWPFSDPSWQYYQDRWISEMPSDRVVDIATAGQRVWFASDMGLTRFDTKTGEWRHFGLSEGLLDNQVLDLEVTGDYLYIATENGLNRLLLEGNTLEKVRDSRFVSLRFNSIAAQGDTLWAGTPRGIFRRPGLKAEWDFVVPETATRDDQVRAIAVKDSVVWFATGGGAIEYHLKSERWEGFPQLALEITPPYRDIAVTSGGVFIATGEGLLKFDRQGRFWKLFTESDGLLDNRCYKLLPDGQFLWIVTDSGLTQFRWYSEMRADY